MKEKKQLPTKLFLALLGLIFMLPLIITFTNSFMGENEIIKHYTTTPSTFDYIAGITESFSKMQLVPEKVTGSSYLEVLMKQPSFLILLGNSLKITLPIVLGNIIVSLLTAYGFTVWKFRYKEAVFMVFIVVMLMPLQAVLVPNYIMADILKIKDSYLAIILPGIFSPFGVFLMRQGMKSIPEAYFEAAKIDGASHFQIFLSVVLPQMKSTTAALAMLTFTEYWNIVEQAVVFITDYRKEPLSVYLSRIASGRVGLIFAASMVYLAVPLWLLFVGQKSLEEGIGLSGIK